MARGEQGQHPTGSSQTGNGVAAPGGMAGCGQSNGKLKSPTSSRSISQTAGTRYGNAQLSVGHVGETKGGVLMTDEIVACPGCNSRVLAMLNGRCPSCGHQIRPPDEPQHSATRANPGPPGQDSPTRPVPEKTHISKRSPEDDLPFLNDNENQLLADTPKLCPACSNEVQWEKCMHCGRDLLPGYSGKERLLFGAIGIG